MIKRYSDQEKQRIEIAKKRSPLHGAEFKAVYGCEREDERETADGEKLKNEMPESDDGLKAEDNEGEKVKCVKTEEYEDNDEPNNEDKLAQENSDADLADEIMKGASPCNTKPQTSVARSECGGISIVNSNCGKRIEFSKKILAALGEPENVQLLFNEKYLIIKSADQQGFPLRKMGARKVIYSAGLVGEITGKFSLDFNNRTCISFSDYTEINNDSAVAVVLKII